MQVCDGTWILISGYFKLVPALALNVGTRRKSWGAESFSLVITTRDTGPATGKMTQAYRKTSHGSTGISSPIYSSWNLFNVVNGLSMSQKECSQIYPNPDTVYSLLVIFSWIIVTATIEVCVCLCVWDRVDMPASLFVHAYMIRQPELSKQFSKLPAFVL